MGILRFREICWKFFGRNSAEILRKQSGKVGEEKFSEFFGMKKIGVFGGEILWRAKI